MQLHKQQPNKGYNTLALQAAERARARSLVDLLTEANADIRQGVAPQLLEKERNLQQRLDANDKRRAQLLNGKYTPNQLAALEKDTNALLTQYQQIQTQIRQSSPRYAALTQPQPLTLAQMQKLLDPNTVLLEYFLGEERSYLWMVTSNGISSYELPKQEQIETAARQYYQLLTDKRLDLVETDLAQVSDQLSQMLLFPVANQLGEKRLVIVSDGALQYIPFAALKDPVAKDSNQPQPLIVKHEVVNLPSASALAVTRSESKRKLPPKTLAVFADPVFDVSDERVKKRPDAKPPQVESSVIASLTRSTSDVGIANTNQSVARLPGTEIEAEKILSLVPANSRQQAFGFAANFANATNPNLSQYRMIHFATHGLLNSENPELSGVVLSLVDSQGNPQNGFLGLRQVYNLKLPAQLVVLSACQTGLGKEIQGEGLVGLTRGFMYAGTPRVVASLWSVNDAATAELMKRFYQNMLQKKLTQAAALRSAQVELWQQQQIGAPYYWAAFVLQGDW